MNYLCVSLFCKVGGKISGAYAFAIQMFFNQAFTLFAFTNCFWVEYHENVNQKPAIFSIKNFSNVIAEKW